MTREFIGDACAYIKQPGGEKAKYYRIGSAYRDGERISIKIDTLPLSGIGWDGWVNVFRRDAGERPRTPSRVGLATGERPADAFDDDDLPF